MFGRHRRQRRAQAWADHFVSQRRFGHLFAEALFAPTQLDQEVAPMKQYEIPAPQFEIFETVEKTPDAPIKPAASVGKVESRAWVEFHERPGYWRYTVRWPMGGTSSESDEHLQTADRLYCDLRVVVSGAPFKFESWTTESVDVLIERALEKAGVVIRPNEWTLRSAEGAEIKHLVGDAGLHDGETIFYLDPQVGGGGDVEVELPPEPHTATGKRECGQPQANPYLWRGESPCEEARASDVDVADAAAIELIRRIESGKISNEALVLAVNQLG